MRLAAGTAQIRDGLVAIAARTAAAKALARSDGSRVSRYAIDASMRHIARGQAMAGKIFLNYRRVDADAWADRLFERLITQYPRRVPWTDWLDKQVAACDLMLVLIGRTWVREFKAKTEPGERDFVRVEIESCLEEKIPESGS